MWEINEVPFMEWMKQEGHEVQGWEKQPTEYGETPILEKGPLPPQACPSTFERVPCRNRVIDGGNTVFAEFLKNWSWFLRPEVGEQNKAA